MGERPIQGAGGADKVSAVLTDWATRPKKKAWAAGQVGEFKGRGEQSKGRGR